jgi:hypothetical protein
MIAVVEWEQLPGDDHKRDCEAAATFVERLIHG